MFLARILSRGFIIVSLIALYMGLALLVALFVRDICSRRRIVVWLSHQMSKLWVYFFNVHIDWQLPPAVANKAYLVLANHMSYMDIPIIFSKFPCIFITSVEIKNTPLLGHFCRLATCLFVDRKRKANIKSEIAEIKTTLAAGLSVGLFPEGTSTNGAQILPFRKSLLESAVGSEIELLPVCLRYVKINQIALNAKTADTVCWYGDMGFFPHFIKLLGTKCIDATVSCSTPFPALPGVNRKELSERAYSAIVEMHQCPI